ncbi:class I SAM-dependent methyltransferase [Chloroflexota bacterium]
MRPKKRVIIYDEQVASEYDEVRFTDIKGKLFHELEMNLFKNTLFSIPLSSCVLEVGVGTGRFTAETARLEHNLHGVDISESMIKQSIRKTNNANYYVAEGGYLPFKDKTFDFIYSIRVLNQMISKEYAINAIEEMVRVCKTGGLILIEFVNRNSLSILARRGIQLTLREIYGCLQSSQNIKVVKVAGVLLLSQTFMNMLPSFMLPVFKRFDNLFTKICPAIATRCYIELHKTGL